MNERMTETAAQDGLEFRFDIARGGNTFDAHRLLHLAAAHGRQHELKERLMRAYLGEGELMSDHAALTRLALEAGLPEDEVRDTLATDRFADEVREDEATARGLGISAVPFFVIDRRFGARRRPAARGPRRGPAPRLGGAGAAGRRRRGRRLRPRRLLTPQPR